MNFMMLPGFRSRWTKLLSLKMNVFALQGCQIHESLKVKVFVLQGCQILRLFFSIEFSGDGYLRWFIPAER